MVKQLRPRDLSVEEQTVLILDLTQTFCGTCGHPLALHEDRYCWKKNGSSDGKDWCPCNQIEKGGAWKIPVKGDKITTSTLDKFTGWVSSGTTSGPIKNCVHDQQEFSLDSNRKVYLSSYDDVVVKTRVEPEVGVYMYSKWIEGRVSGLTKPKILYLGWPDFQGFPLQELYAAATAVNKLVEQGKHVEIGCQGGHGRTGTFTAAVLIVRGKTADEAVKQVRKEYCKWAIEGETQMKLLHTLDKAVRKLDGVEEVAVVKKEESSGTVEDHSA